MTIVEGIKIIGTSEHAEQYPMLSDEEIQSLADDIAENGLFDPITVTSDGILLDGRNRLRACELAGVEPRIDIYDGDDEQIGAFVRSKNRRRHQPTGSRAMSEALSMKIDGKREGGRWVHGSLPDQESGGSAAFSRRLREAGFVIDFAPDLAEQVVTGDLALDAAFREAEQRRDAERQRLEQQKRLEAEEADSRAFVEENAPGLAAQVGDVFQSYVEAHDVWKRRNREEAERIRREQAAKERAERERKASLTEMYSNGIGRALMTLGSYGQRDNPADVMSEFSADLLDPPQLQKQYSSDNIRAAQRFLESLLEWSSK